MPRKTLSEAIKAKYEPRALVVLNNIREELTRAGYTVSEPFELDDEDAGRWDMVVEPCEGREEVIDISFHFAESENWDGEKGGINFMLDVVSEGGRMLGGLTPYNYTEDVWVPRKNAAAVEERFAIIEAADAFEVVGLVEGYN